MTGIQNQTSSYYVPRSRSEKETGFILASLASGAVMSTLPMYSKPFIKQIKNEVINNNDYKNSLLKAFKNSALLKDGVKFRHFEYTANDMKLLGGKYENTILNKDIKAGLNACYVPDFKEVRLNLKKSAASGFHECGHALNHLESKLGKLLQKCRQPGYAVAGIMGYLALFSRKKPKGEKRNAYDFVQDNCGKIAFLSLLPTVAEESMASYKGLKLAKSGGLSEALIKNLRKLYGKALLSYIGYAVATGFSVFLASKITDNFTRPKKINLEDDSFSNF